MAVQRTSFFLLVFVLALLTASHPCRADGAAGIAARDGVFVGPFWWPVVGIHTVQLPTGDILNFSYPVEGMGPQHSVIGKSEAWVFRPATKQLWQVNCHHNIFCGGHSILPDGRVLVTGGTLSLDPDLGSRDAHLFDPYARSWIKIADMARGRFYPTHVTLPDGRVLVLSGVDEHANPNPLAEVYEPGVGWSIIPFANKVLELYPHLHLLSSGRVFLAGPEADSETFDPATGRWTLVDRSQYGRRSEGCSFLVPLHTDRVMVLGGYGGKITRPPTRTTELIDLTDPEPRWVWGPSTAYRRVFANAVILPDATVLLVGGEEKVNDAYTAVLPAEIYDPQKNEWRVVASLNWPRLYHSSVGLLPDGRVLIAGGDMVQNVEFYWPPYMFKPRPAIVQAPATIEYGFPFTLACQTGNAGAIMRVALLKLTATTHSVTMDQRYVTLDFVCSTANQLTVRSPRVRATAPPGHYLLVVVAESGGPSVARMVELKG